jgi:Tfp pilus assembly protein PilF
MNIDTLLKLIGTERDSAMLRLTLARLLAANDDPEQAEIHLAAATEMDPDYTAAWKELGKVRQKVGNHAAAAQAWQEGIKAARANGDKQAEKEMAVFLKRVTQQRPGSQ